MNLKSSAWQEQEIKDKPEYKLGKIVEGYGKLEYGSVSVGNVALNRIVQGTCWGEDRRTGRSQCGWGARLRLYRLQVASVMRLKVEILKIFD